MFGHQKIAGFVTTENFGQACLFRVDVPEIPECEVTIERGAWVNSEYALPGSKVKQQAEPGYSKLIGPGAVYAMNPCTEATVRAYIEANRKLPLIPLDLVKRQAIAAPDEDDSDRPDSEDLDF